MEYIELEITLRSESERVRQEGQDWPPEKVAEKLVQVADIIAKIRRQHQTGINASLGKRSGRTLDNI